MSPDDVRHGTYAGYDAHRRDGDPVCATCRAAAARYEYHRRIDQILGRPRLVPSVGTARRMQALVALGWTFSDLAREMGCSHDQTRKWALQTDTMIHASTAESVDVLFRRLCMTPPAPVTRVERRNAAYARTVARRRGWAAPLMWDDIDTDPAPARTTSVGRRPDLYDHAVVERVLASGERPRRLTSTEGEEIVRRALARGMSTKDIREVYGIKAERHVHVTDPEAAA